MFEDEKKFENTQGTETPAAGTAPTPETANPAAGQSAGACDPYAYQNGYYRNTAPHQDEPVNSGAYSQPQTASSGSGSQVPPTSQNGYSYVNYYSDPNSGNHQKPKKKHTGLKAVACVLAMVLVSGASIGIYEGIRSSMETSSAVVSDSSEDTAEKSDSSASDDSSTGSVQSSFSTNVVPFPIVLSAHSVPPMPSARPFAMASPRPLPPRARLRESSGV